MAKSIGLAGLVVFLLALIVFQYYITAVPDLEEPITVGDVRSVDENQSLLVSLQGSKGRNFTIGLRGDVANKPEETALFYIRNPEFVPYVYWPGLRSNDEKRVLNLLRSWAENNIGAGLKERLDADKTKPMDQGEIKVAAAYRIYSVLKDRN